MVPTLIGLLRISSTQTLSSDSTSDSSVLVSQTNRRGGRNGNRSRGQRPHCIYCNKFGHTRDCCYQLHGLPALPTWPNHLILILNSPRLRAPPHLKVFPPLTMSMMTIFAIRHPSQLMLLLLSRSVMPLPA